ncbi:hypothetical protein H5410_052411 [Solanum commersonii]|uniref:Uncharacterized protein n=1 Tax=Solanum commersonii TaxID=4109 RepID=A0A9J5X407_SOLCO|nr:hypothetical protein H5410_052411 [Solanum commersonii]
MGSMGLGLISWVHIFILFSGDAGLNLEVGVESKHVRPFGELGRACRTTQWFTESPLITFNFMLDLEFWSNHKRERGIVINEGGPSPPKKGGTKPPKGGKSKGKRPTSEVSKHNSNSEGSQAAFSEP